MEEQDNLKVVKPQIVGFRLTPEQVQQAEAKEREQYRQQNQQTISDADKARYYANMQNIINNNAFGYQFTNSRINFNPTTTEGQQAIQSNFDYIRDNALGFTIDLGMAGTSGLANRGARLVSKVRRGVFRTPSKNGALGTFKQYTKTPIGEGAEAVVIDNTPTTVGKITTIPVEEMNVRNGVPRAIESKYVGYVRGQGEKYPTYVQQKVRMADNTPKALDKLDKAMQKSGYKVIDKESTDTYRAYTNGTQVIDDVGEGQLGYTRWLPKIFDRFRTPVMIDFNVTPLSEWLAQGYKLKKGGSIHIKKENRGKFTESAKKAGQSVQEHARSVLNNSNATPLQKKRANFARNAAKWKK